MCLYDYVCVCVSSFSHNNNLMPTFFYFDQLISETVARPGSLLQVGSFEDLGDSEVKNRHPYDEKDQDSSSKSHDQQYLICYNHHMGFKGTLHSNIKVGQMFPYLKSRLMFR